MLTFWLEKKASFQNQKQKQKQKLRVTIVNKSRSPRMDWESGTIT
jgi:hypothetical protein